MSCLKKSRKTRLARPLGRRPAFPTSTPATQAALNLVTLAPANDTVNVSYDTHLQITFDAPPSFAVVTNDTLGTNFVTISGLPTPDQNLEFDNVLAGITGTNIFGASPLTLNGGSVTNTGSLSLTNGSIQNFYLGANTGSVGVTGSLVLKGTINIFATPGFARRLPPVHLHRQPQRHPHARRHATDIFANSTPPPPDRSIWM